MNLDYLPADQLQKLFEYGSIIVLLESPPGMEVGIDLKSWKVGQKFKGIKLIPPGFHVVYYSSSNKEGGFGTRSAFFCYTKPSEIITRGWCTETEKFNDGMVLSTDKYELDRFLGPYPVESYQTWMRMTKYISEDLLNKVIPSKCFTSMTQSRFSSVPEFSSGYLNEKEGIPLRRTTAEANDEDFLVFTPFDLKKSYPENAPPDVITKYSMDKSFLLSQVIQISFNGGKNASK
jgi:A1 cistron-splicing factor AAR2